MAMDLRLVHNVGDFVICLTSDAANALLIFLILTRTTKDFKPYSRLLLWCSIVDMLYTLTPFISPVSFFGQRVLLLIARTLSNKEMGAIYLVAVIFSIFVWLSSVWCASPFEEKMREHAWKLQEDSMWANDMPNFVVFSINDPKTIVFVSATVVFSLVTSGIVIFVNIAIGRQLRDVQNMSPQTAKMQRQLTKVLMAQVTIPVISFCFPLFGFFVSIIISVAEQTFTSVTIIACMISASTCILNPVAAIYLVPQYRKAVESFICARKSHSGGSQQVKMVTPPVQSSSPTNSSAKQNNGPNSVT
ncbi:serpentine type 7TM GPCR chemoreceptor srd domain-containing protein [Ditylenchus destructor]|uniref:Serpentine type 7TM GPCR chemoreceptor srd domain-containing protein n=1 Tax=Ditylenchus destructor TaxID=166010 RepID=A0AAD4N538_9BILA|nr:serpentine type 7TM GPCR chemoreceptor srd domain-containing protein [Ditylenchus destructor]